MRWKFLSVAFSIFLAVGCLTVKDPGLPTPPERFKKVETLPCHACLAGKDCARVVRAVSENIAIVASHTHTCSGQ